MDQYIGRFLDNRYEILELIGTGGMAVVYKARCHRLNRLVAIKILKDDFSREEEFRRRFHAEGEAVASLSHPNIVQVYDVSSSENANFIVMELIDGITLKQYMAKKGTLNWKETLHFAIQIAKALEHAHGRSIVHRDIKPHNVMVLKNGSVKVTDFGIARVMSKSNTLTKEALGSVHYISPEQAKGGWVDNRSDLYSLSVVMYEMMTGRPPYDGESPVAVAIKHINGGAPAPSSLNPNIPGGLEQIIMKGMALDVKDRYSSATEMLQDMDQFRMNPSILFTFASSVPADATIVLKPGEVAEAARQSRTTAERVASHTGSVPKPRPVQQTNRTVSQNTARQQSVRTASNPNLRTVSSAETARRAAESRSSASRRKTREEIRREVREEERNRAATIAVVACSAVAIIAILIFLVVLVNGGLVGRGEKMVYVPDLKGQYVDQTGSVTGLVIEIDKYVNNDEYEKGKIIEHTPEYGAQVLQGTVVKVTVSLGPEPEAKTMSYMVGYQEADARAVLTGMGMVPVAMEEFNDYVEKGKVSRTDPAVGEVLTEGQTVYIYISKGPLIEKAEMPKLVGLDYATAKKMLLELGFESANISYERKESKADKDEVIEQPFEEGEQVDVTTKVVLVISKGGKTNTGTSNEKPKQEDKEEIPDYVPENPVQIPNQSSGTGSSQGSSGGTTANKNKTKKVTFTLPTDRTEQYLLGLYQNNMQVIEDTIVSPDRTSIDMVLTGSGTATYELYINNQFYKSVKVDFEAND
ncbi:MAG: Stk1 family PASTA domain-containing Ser/Thr kinase [Oscillospiraceae bacterium]|nr:Stk1 family PASTA domain-containing Ser/Thr kinase [Oscillospiraceae bacterium]